MSIREQAEQFWNRPSEAEARKVISSPTEWEHELEPHLRLILDVDSSVAKHLPVCDTDIAALEIGCGIGRLLAPLSARGWEMHGVDISENMLKFGAEYLKSRGAALVQMHLLTDASFPIADAKIDLVYSLMVFQHIPEHITITQYLKESYRVLKPGGVIRIQTHRGLAPPAGEFHGYAGHMYPDVATFAAEFTAAGFKVLSTQKGLGHAEWLWVTALKPSNCSP